MLMQHLQKTEVAPPIQVPYGLVLRDKVVGIVFTVEAGDGSLCQEFYLLDDHGCKWVTTLKLHEKWLARFWKEYSTGGVIDLSARIKRFPCEVLRKHQGGNTWLDFDSSDGKFPAIVPGDPYKFCGATGGEATSASGAAEADLRDWFHL